MIDIGNATTRKELGLLLGEPNLAKTREGVFNCKNSSRYLLFVNLNKDSAKENLKFDDYFQDEVFHWDSQPKQSITVPSIRAIVEGDREVHLFARIYPKIKSKTQPYIYCGQLIYKGYDERTANPVHMIFRVKEMRYDLEDDHPLSLIYHWKPSHEGQKGSYNSRDLDSATKGAKRSYKKPNETERRGLVTSRVGQGYYRHRVREKWQDTCPVTGYSSPNILIASHIVPWKSCNDAERLDEDNGILLSPNVDALFDKHLISFGDDGRLILGSKVTAEDLQVLGIPTGVVIDVTEGMKPFLHRHRSLLK